MSVVFVILGFVLICLILVHINLHQKKKELYDFIKNVNKAIMKRHKKISMLLELLDENEMTNDIKKFNEAIIEKIQKNELMPSQEVKVEILIEEKMNNLLTMYENKDLDEKVIEAIEAYKKAQKRVNKNKKKYNDMIEEFMDACNIKPALWYASFENIDTDFPKLAAIKE